MRLSKSFILLLACPLIYAMKGGTCPPDDGLSSICVIDYDTYCWSSNDCPGPQLCCPSGCNKECKDPITPTRGPTTRPGKCPKVIPSQIGACQFTDQNCVQHSDCPRGQMCCRDSCGKICKSVGKQRRTTTTTPFPTDFPSEEHTYPDYTSAPPTFGRNRTGSNATAVNSTSNSNPWRQGSTSGGQVQSSIDYERNYPALTESAPMTCPPRPRYSSYTVCRYDPSKNCVQNSDCSAGKICCTSTCGKECTTGVAAYRSLRRGEVW